MRRRIAIATGTRADWGLLSPVACALARRDDCEVEVLATNMHLIPEYGDTITEIVADGFASVRRVEMPVVTDTPLSTVNAMAGCMEGMAKALTEMRPDCIVILGDRFEMLATATAALMTGVPIVHIAGGEISEGAVDDSIRHAITKMSWLHLTATEPYRERVIAMGEEPDRVLNTGAIGVWNMLHSPRPTRRALEESIGFSLPEGSLLVTYHPATLDEADPAMRCRELLSALEMSGDRHILITYPNNDARGRVIIALIEEYARLNPRRVRVVPSLGRQRYIAALQCVSAVIGNSSSGIVEVPSMGIPTVDIGIRQRGRLAGPSVIHCGDSRVEIAQAISMALTPEMQEVARTAPNPYAKADTLDIMAETIATSPLSLTKHFHDL
ncbi:MAG: UDP-N-acetylglucosamine 2-epimerase [Muribaculaceae bacterium]|nr:UDP-N-acetylglucosamine 2-epimerase [Muribaculaceae bacterium]